MFHINSIWMEVARARQEELWEEAETYRLIRMASVCRIGLVGRAVLAVATGLVALGSTVRARYERASC